MSVTRRWVIAPFFVARKCGLRLPKPFHLFLGLESTRSIACESLANDGGQRFFSDEQLGPSFDGFVFIALGSGVKPKNQLHRIHLLRHLSPVQLTLQRALGGYDSFNRFAFGRLIKLEVQASDPRAPCAKCLAQIEMETSVVGNSFEIVEDHNKAFIWLGIKERHKCGYARTFYEIAATGDSVGKGHRNLMAPPLRMLVTVELSAFQPMGD